MKFLFIVANIETKKQSYYPPQWFSSVKLQPTKKDHHTFSGSRSKSPVRQLSGGQAGRAAPGIPSIGAPRESTELQGRVEAGTETSGWPHLRMYLRAEAGEGQPFNPKHCPGQRPVPRFQPRACPGPPSGGFEHRDAGTG